MQGAPSLLWRLLGHQGQSGTCAGGWGTFLAGIQEALTFFEPLAWGLGWEGMCLGREEEWLERGWGSELESNPEREALAK